MEAGILHSVLCKGQGAWGRGQACWVGPGKGSGRGGLLMDGFCRTGRWARVPGLTLLDAGGLGGWGKAPTNPKSAPQLLQV